MTQHDATEEVRARMTAYLTERFGGLRISQTPAPGCVTPDEVERACLAFREQLEREGFVFVDPDPPTVIFNGPEVQIVPREAAREGAALLARARELMATPAALYDAPEDEPGEETP
jgi:Asp-tRNA(Asn)/Glu-tRNA(Gln) amidotransferase A subunit family amidase